MTSALRTGLLAAAALVGAASTAVAAPPPGAVRNVVLVHGAWADGSGWRGVYDDLTARGYTVSIVQNPLTSLADDVAATRRVLARQNGPTVLVGHSYGGAVISQAGDHPKVAGLVYVAAFAPDVGESAFGLIPKDAPPPPIEPTADGFAYFNRGAFLAAFATGIEPATANLMADAQVPISLANAGMAPLTIAAWKAKPSWYVVASEDHIIPPDGQRLMAKRAHATVTEIKGGHIAFVNQPKIVADAIEAAAKGALAKAN